MFDFLFGNKNPTTKWEKDPSVSLRIEIGEPQINGVRLGDSIERLHFLGPADEYQVFRTRKEIRYLSQGLSVGIDNKTATVSDFMIEYIDPNDDDIQPYSGDLFLHGTKLNLATVNEDDVLDADENYFHIEEEEDENTIFYEWPNSECRICFEGGSEYNQYVSIEVSIERELDNPALREEMGINTWPASFESLPN